MGTYSKDLFFPVVTNDAAGTAFTILPRWHDAKLNKDLPKSIRTFLLQMLRAKPI